MKYTQDEIYSLVKKLSELDAGEITVKSEDLTIKIKHGNKAINTDYIRPSVRDEVIEQPSDTEEIEQEKPGKTIEAPINGTYYCASGPDEPPYIKEGDRIKAGEPVCILEAMKMMNTINMPEDGVILSVEVSNEDIVDAGQTLVRYDTI
jgi:biotin carboxyl carrier protein